MRLTSSEKSEGEARASSERSQFIHGVTWEEWQQWSDKKQQQLTRFCFLQMCMDIHEIKVALQQVEIALKSDEKVWVQ